MRDGTRHNMNIICDYRSIERRLQIKYPILVAVERYIAPIVYREVCGQKYNIQVPKKIVVNDSCGTNK